MKRGLPVLGLVALPVLSAAYWDPDLAMLGIRLEPANVAPGQRYWRLVDAWADSPSEGGGNVDIYYWTRNPSGGAAPSVWVNRGTPLGPGIVQTNGEGYGNLRMEGGNWCPATPPGPYSCRVHGRDYANPDPSDAVIGMGLPCNYHWSYRLIFQETTAPLPTTTPTRSPTPGADADGDELPDALEGYPPVLGQGNRWLPDSDGDGLRDGAEDSNANGLRDAGETSVRLADSDNDGIEDGVERLILQSDALNPASPVAHIDGDGDGLPVWLDFNDNHVDTDGDRYLDGYEAVQVSVEASADAGRKPTLGDLNDDGLLSNLDALITHALFLFLADPAQVATGRADANRDGFVTNLDALALQSFFLYSTLRLPL